MNKYVKYVLIFAAGVTAGVGGSYYVFKGRFQAKLDAEVERLKEESPWGKSRRNEALKASMDIHNGSGSGIVAPVKIDDGTLKRPDLKAEHKDYAGLAGTYNKESKVQYKEEAGDEINELTDEESDEDDVPGEAVSDDGTIVRSAEAEFPGGEESRKGPHVIDEEVEEPFDEKGDYESESLTYYTGDNILAYDTTMEKVPIDIVGGKRILRALQHEKTGVLYVRDDKVGRDYELSISKENYHDLVN